MKHQEIFPGIQLYRIGNPVLQGRFLIHPDETKWKTPPAVPHFTHKETKESIILTYTMAPDEILYGLGESLGGLNKRGKKYRCFCNDDPLHTPEKEALYGSHPFMILKGKKNLGILIEYPGEILIDAGFTDYNQLTIEIRGNYADIYLFETPDWRNIVRDYLILTGAPYIPPKWAFGFQQSRWSYPDAPTIDKIASDFRKHGIPCDAIYMDIDYMEHYKVFTIDKKKFPDFKKLVHDMKKKGFRLLPIIDPGVKVEKDYDIYEEGIQGDFFCKTGKGEIFTAAVWPGITHLPDFLKKETAEWWGSKYSILIDQGIEGFWNDMNEPALFYTERGLNEVVKAVSEKDKADQPLFKMKDAVLAVSNNGEDYRSFYHEIDGKKINHYDVHNLYGTAMTRSAVAGIRKNYPDLRYFMLSRSSSIGMHRYAAIWMGDNQSWWEHMAVHVQMLQSLNLCGFFYTGPDIGGFGCNTSPELVTRWMQLGAVTPLYRNHSALGTRNQEPWAFDEATTRRLKDTVRLRYALLPYLYSQYFQSVSSLTPMITPVSWYYEDPVSLRIEDQFFVGESLLCAPVIQSNARGRYVTLPENRWLFWNASSFEKRECIVLNPDHYHIEVPLECLPLFIRENHLVILTEPQNYTGEKPVTDLYVIGLVSRKATIQYYDDDGVTNQYQQEKFYNIIINVERENGKLLYSYSTGNDSYQSHLERIHFEIYDESGTVHKETIKLIK